MLHIDIRAEIPVEDQTGQRAIQQAEIEVIQRIIHHGLLIRPETQFMRGKAPAVQRHGGVHQRAARVTAAAKGQSHQKTSCSISLKKRQINRHINGLRTIVSVGGALVKNHFDKTGGRRPDEFRQNARVRSSDHVCRGHKEGLISSISAKMCSKSMRNFLPRLTLNCQKAIIENVEKCLLATIPAQAGFSQRR